MIESDVNQERQLARTLIELREVFTRTRMLLPSSSLQEILLLAGAVEQAKSEGLSVRKGRPPGVTNTSKLPEPQKALPQPQKMFPQLTGIKKVRLKVTINKKHVPVLEALCLFLSEQKKPSTVRQVVEGFEARKWKINSASAKPLVSTFRLVLNRHTNVFRSVAKDRAVLYSLKAPPKHTPAPPKKLNPLKVREAVITTLRQHGKPLTGPDLAKKVGVDNAQRLSMLLVSLSKKGSIKKTSKGGVIFWTTPNKKEKKLPDSGPNGKMLNGAGGMNGVAHA